MSPKIRFSGNQIAVLEVALHPARVTSLGELLERARERSLSLSLATARRTLEAAINNLVQLWNEQVPQEEGGDILNSLRVQFTAKDEALEWLCDLCEPVNARKENAKWRPSKEPPFSPTHLAILYNLLSEKPLRQTELAKKLQPRGVGYTAVRSGVMSLVAGKLERAWEDGLPGESGTVLALLAERFKNPREAVEELRAWRAVRREPKTGRRRRVYARRIRGSPIPPEDPNTAPRSGDDPNCQHKAWQIVGRKGTCADCGATRMFPPSLYDPKKYNFANRPVVKALAPPPGKIGRLLPMSRDMRPQE